ncbi:3'(2'),5'-bisphosphate nucleotidase [Mucisphaera calidilacus]|uniref:3'(2'),5'-bisphosphate nucleotidase n=1 Tax=Mucisphaera calidilacus TaxID=2527982 RepID=A0A518BUU4_9BACT|nr:3'(2'),5'-bisphosphate nucleotidase [Mucisphaera calidilacus]QDU70704.1 Inositol-1-monophosphatase [Mucisphaera calidilacus]
MTTPLHDQAIQHAIEAVILAADACRRVQQRRITPQTLEKRDKSPVTVADFAAQALVCHHLAENASVTAVVGEESADALRSEDEAATRAAVTEEVSESLGIECSEENVLGWIDRGSAAIEPGKGTYWTLDPIDGTKGFLRREQYAVALGLIEDGRVVLGVLACPNLEMPDAPGTGTLLAARRGQGVIRYSLAEDGSLDAHDLRATDDTTPRFCESVESAHSDQDQAAAIAQRIGITAPPYRIDSQAKYASLAAGLASVYLRMPTRPGYREKIWDHAAGSIVVEEAGGTVTDILGKPLDFSLGRELTANRGIAASVDFDHASIINAVTSVATLPSE